MITLEAQSLDLDEVKKAALIQALKMHRGNMSATARELGLDRRTLYRLCDRWEHAGDKEFLEARRGTIQEPVRAPKALVGGYESCSGPSPAALGPTGAQETTPAQGLSQNSWQDL